MTDPCTDYTGTPDVGSGYIEQVDGASGECQGCDFSEGGTSSQVNRVADFFVQAGIDTQI